jgi:hypothetical protein
MSWISKSDYSFSCLLPEEGNSCEEPETEAQLRFIVDNAERRIINRPAQNSSNLHLHRRIKPRPLAPKGV